MKAGRNISCFIYIQKWGCDVQVHAEETVWAADILRLWTRCNTLTWVSRRRHQGEPGISMLTSAMEDQLLLRDVCEWWEHMVGRGKLWDTVKTLNCFKSVLHIKPQTIKWLLSLLLVWLWHFMDRTSVQLFISPNSRLINGETGHGVGNSMEAMCTDAALKIAKHSSW